jgi:hypothetical protein
VDVTPAVGL